jgi:hypothetical protein
MDGIRAPGVIAALVMVLGCSQSHPNGAPFSPEVREIDLTAEQYRALCDWWKAERGWPEEEWILCLDGGAGTRLRGPEACVLGRHPPEEIPDCALTVGQWSACIEEQPDGCPPYSDACIRPRECIADGRAGFLVP